MKRLFFGGIHPEDRKALSAGSMTLTPLTPREVAIPLSQHIGVPCTPLVQPGDQVRLGQKIGDGEGLCVPVHASVSGTVRAVELRPHPRGGKAMSIVIENDGLDTPVNEENPKTDQKDPDAVLHAIREAGIVGMGGAAFPSDVKALSSMGKMDVLIANACECEPYITADATLLRTDPAHILDGMRILAGVLKPERLVLAVEDNKAEAIGVVKKQMARFPEIELLVLPTRYPQGAEKQLVQAVTGREIPPGKLPSAVGCGVFNVSTFAAIYRAVEQGTPLTRRLVTVSGEGVMNPRNFIVPIGTSFRDVIEAAGGLREDIEKVISGGPMMGTALETLDVPVVKATNSILCLSKGRPEAAAHPVCIRCGKCVAACPMRLQPLYLYRYEKAGDAEELNRLNVLDCVECGSCAYVCPGKLPLVEKIRSGKKIVKEGAKK